MRFQSRWDLWGDAIYLEPSYGRKLSSERRLKAISAPQRTKKEDLRLETTQVPLNRCVQTTQRRLAFGGPEYQETLSVNDLVAGSSGGIFCRPPRGLYQGFGPTYRYIVQVTDPILRERYYPRRALLEHFAGRLGLI